MRPSVHTLGSCLLTACATTPVVEANPVAQARGTLQRMIRSHELPGAQYVVVSATQTLADLHLGTADAASARPMQRDTLQLTYSVTKALTAVAVLQLIERGALELDRPLSDYYPAHPYGPDVTLRRLLAHTSGVPNPMPLDWFALEHEPLDRHARLVALLQRHPKLKAEPGSKYLYTNLGYWLLEALIEVASGQDYADYMNEHVFAPVGVTPAEAGFELPPESVAAVGHTRQLSPMTLVLRALTPGRYWDTPHGGWSRAARLRPHGRAYGGLYSNAGALGRVLQDLLRPDSRLLSAAGRARLFEPQHTRDGQPGVGALGWVIGELDGARYFGKQGGGLGFHGNLRIYPELNLATVLLANRTELTPSPIDARSDALDAGFVRLACAGRAAGAVSGSELRHEARSR
jgi:D-alanyl-D-alanine carboxypeptidase